MDVTYTAPRDASEVAQGTDVDAPADQDSLVERELNEAAMGTRDQRRPEPLSGPEEQSARERHMGTYNLRKHPKRKQFEH